MRALLHALHERGNRGAAAGDPPAGTGSDLPPLAARAMR